MDVKRTLAKAISSVLENWAALDEAHKGISYDDAVKHLEAWKNDIEGEMQCLSH